jgi:hypothetical protein
MEKAIPQAREKSKPSQPQFADIKLPKALIGKLIGPGQGGHCWVGDFHIWGPGIRPIPPEYDRLPNP